METNYTEFKPETCRKHRSPIGWGDMVKQAYDLKKQFQLENPIKLDLKTATFEQVGFHAERWQRLSQSTIEHRLRCARRMQKHPIFLIDFNDLSYDQFIAYMNTRERYRGILSARAKRLIFSCP